MPASGTVWYEDFPWPGLRPVPHPVRNPSPFCSIRSPRETQTLLRLSRSRSRSCRLFYSLIPTQGQGWSLCGGGEELGLSSRAPCIWAECTQGGGRNSSPRWAFPLLCSTPALSSPREGEKFPWAEPKGKDKVPLLSLSWFMLFFKLVIFKTHHSLKKKKSKTKQKASPGLGKGILTR